MNKQIEGIILREKDYGDTSKILDVFTKEFGIISMIAKGAKTLKSSLRSVTSKFTYGIFNIYYKENKLSNLKEVDIIDNLKNIKTDIIKIAFATFLLELAEQVYKQNSNINVYELLISALFKINMNFDPFVITNILELKYLEYLGIMPNLNECCICGDHNIVTLSIDKGGFVCSNCRTIEPIVNNKTLKLIRMFYYVDISKIAKLNISEPIKKEINNFLEVYYDKYTGLYLKSKKILTNLQCLS